MNQPKWSSNPHNNTQARSQMLAWVVTCAVVMLTLQGCGGPRVIHLKGNAEDAVEAVVDTLKAWKAGKKPAELHEELSIIARDNEWDSGLVLHSFTVDKTAREDGPTWRVDAFLTFGAGGKPASYPVQAAYSVTLQPSVAVFRLDHIE